MSILTIKSYSSLATNSSLSTKRLVATCLSVAILAGCSNAVSYHHSERNSIALEVRGTDPQQPVQGIIGVKTRTILVTPGIEEAEQEDEGEQKGQATAKGESTSVISDFKLKREEAKEFFAFGSTHLQSALITGDAAKNAPKSTSKALSGIGISGASDEATLQLNVMQDIYSFLNERKATDAIAKKHVEQLDNLAELLPKDYLTKTYYDIDSTTLVTVDMASHVVNPRPFLEVLYYEHSLLGGSISSIKEMEQDRNVKYQASAGATAQVITSADLTMLQAKLKQLKADKRTFFDMIGNHNAIDSAAAYMVSML
ncbi:hypothetical protein [Thalassotalea sp. PLHSN55]|uniref:hypothetical protein n=1 Tax=Thalassotalea sp. PLHSN55 TaxID=3435888 RepID=UPI003F82E68A